jgi:hypothetical protein
MVPSKSAIIALTQGKRFGEFAISSGAKSRNRNELAGGNFYPRGGPSNTNIDDIDCISDVYQDKIRLCDALFFRYVKNIGSVLDININIDTMVPWSKSMTCYY